MRVRPAFLSLVADSFCPDEDARLCMSERVEQGAMGIHSVLARIPNERELRRRWPRVSEHQKRERRAEAAECLRRASN